MPSWPATLPAAPLMNGLGMTPQPNVISFGTEVGPGKVRRRSTARVSALAAGLLLTQDQLEDFLAFFRDDLKDGALSFDWTDHVEGDAASFRFLPTDPYRVALAGRALWSVTLNLMRLP